MSTNTSISGRMNTRNANHQKRNHELDEESKATQKKIDNTTAKNNKTIDRTKKAVNKKVENTAKGMNSVLNGSKKNTQRGGNYDKMSLMDIAKDTGKRVVNKTYNAAVDGVTETGKFVYKNGVKPLTEFNTGYRAKVAKKANEGVGCAKKVYVKGKTVVKQGYDKVVTVAKNCGDAAKEAGGFLKNMFGF